MSDQLIHDAAVQASARVGGDLGAAISAHLWAVERLRPALTSDEVLAVLDSDVLAGGRLARAALALDQPVVPGRTQLVVAAMDAVDRALDAGRRLQPSDIVALTVDAVLAVLAALTVLAARCCNLHGRVCEPPSELCAASTAPRARTRSTPTGRGAARRTCRGAGYPVPLGDRFATRRTPLADPSV